MALRPNPESHRAWQQRTRERAMAKPGRAPGSTLAARGARAKRLQPALDAAYAEVDQRDGGCQFHLVDPGHVCPRRALLHHDHLWNRNVRPDLREKAWAIVLVCSVAHDQLTNNPELHRRLRVAALAERISEWIAAGCRAA